MKRSQFTCGSMAFVAAIALTACAASPVTPTNPSIPSSTTPPPPTEQPGSAVPPTETPTPPVRPAPRTFRLGPAANSLATQAQGLSTSGQHAQAAATMERALRIEPDNPLVWLELAKIRLAGGDTAQAENLARRALALSSGAPREQSAAWRIVAEARRAKGDNLGAREAEEKAQTAALAR